MKLYDSVHRHDNGRLYSITRFYTHKKYITHLVINHIYWLGRSFLHLFGIEVWKPERYLRLRCLKVPFRLPDRHRLVWSHTERREGQNNPSAVSLRHQICNLPIGSHVFPFRWRRGHRCFCSPDICHVRGSGDHTQIFSDPCISTSRRDLLLNRLKSRRYPAHH